MSESEKTTVFMENLTALKSAATEIDSMSEPDIDKLIPLVEKGTKAYKACNERIAQVEKYLGIEPDNEDG